MEFAEYVIRFTLVVLVVIALPASAAPPACHGCNLIFKDDFDSLDAAKWRMGVWFEHPLPHLRNFTVNKSELSLTWIHGQQIPDSSISSQRAWRYGYFEARMKWTPARGAWPAMWMIPSPPQTDETGEIDIFEGQGDEPRTVFGTIHRWRGSREIASTSARNRFSIPENTRFADYHTYGLLWEPGRVTWYFDDVPLHSETTFAVLDRQDYSLIVGMQEGQNWRSGDLTGVTADSLTLTVDWVRVWQK